MAVNPELCSQYNLSPGLMRTVYFSVFHMWGDEDEQPQYRSSLDSYPRIVFFDRRADPPPHLMGHYRSRLNHSSPLFEFVFHPGVQFVEVHSNAPSLGNERDFELQADEESLNGYGSSLRGAPNLFNVDGSSSLMHGILPFERDVRATSSLSEMFHAWYGGLLHRPEDTVKDWQLHVSLTVLGKLQSLNRQNASVALDHCGFLLDRMKQELELLLLLVHGPKELAKKPPAVSLYFRMLIHSHSHQCVLDSCETPPSCLKFLPDISHALSECRPIETYWEAGESVGATEPGEFHGVVDHSEGVRQRTYCLQRLGVFSDRSLPDDPDVSFSTSSGSSSGSSPLPPPPHDNNGDAAMSEAAYVSNKLCS